MQNIFLKTSFFLLLASLSWTCNKDSSKSSDIIIDQMVVTISNQDYTLSNSLFDATTNSATVSLPARSTIPKILTVKTFVLAGNATSSLLVGGSLEITDSKATFTATAEDGTTTKTFTIVLKVLESTQFIVDFDAGGGSPRPESQVVNKGGKATKPDIQPYKVGYAFAGWYKDAARTTLFDFDTTIITADIVIYAKLIRDLNVAGVSTYSGGGVLGQGIRDALFADNETAIAVIRLEPDFTYNFSFGGKSFQKKAESGNVIITKADLAGATFNSGDAVVISNGSQSATLATYYPHEIRHWRDLQAMQLNLTLSYTVQRDITFPDPGQDGFPSTGFVPIRGFTGNFDGNGKNYTITKLYINQSSRDSVGLFGSIIGPATGKPEIKNVILKDANIIGNSKVGAICGYAWHTSLNEVGLEATTTSASSSTATVTALATSGGYSYLGGLVGYADGASVVKGFIDDGRITGVLGGVGGLVGYADGVTITGYSTATVTGATVASLAGVGGLVGYVTGDSKIRGFAIGAVTGKTGVGGLVGYVSASNTTGSIIGYSRVKDGATVTGTDSTGGLIGGILSGSVRGYSRSNVVAAATSTSSNTRFGLFIGQAAITANGRVSTGLGSTESQFTVATGGGGTVANGIPGIQLTISGNTGASGRLNFQGTGNGGDFTWGIAEGEWTFVSDKWPVINLDFTTMGSRADKDYDDEQPIN